MILKFEFQSFIPKSNKSKAQEINVNGSLRVFYTCGCKIFGYVEYIFWIPFKFPRVSFQHLHTFRDNEALAIQKTIGSILAMKSEF